MAPMMRAPELTAISSSLLPGYGDRLTSVIVGEIEYDSIVTKRTEPFSIGVSVIGEPGELYT